MGLRTPEQYVESLRDGREVWIMGEKVEDVTTHPNLQITVDHCVNVFALALEPRYQELFTAEIDGEQISRYYYFPKDAQDLELRRQLIDTHTSQARGQLNLIKAIGSDAMMALTVIAHEIKSAGGSSEYVNRVGDYVEWVRKTDPAVVVAQTDVKGDRALRPHEQDDPDMYVRIVEERADGIVVRGAKAHTTSSVTANEIIVPPTRAMGERDRDYAVAFAVPANAKGLKLLCRPMPSIEVSAFDNPISRHNLEVETVTVFDDVFVPADRVFLQGEWQAAGGLANTFANFHRFTGVSYRPPLGDLLIGAAQLVAESNGVGGVAHIREKVADLVMYTEMIRACAIAAAQTYEVLDPGIAMPNTVYTNVGKRHFSTSFHEAVRQIQDVAGGLVITAPVEADLNNSEIGPYLRKYLKGHKDVSTEDRLRLFHFIRDLTASDFGGYGLVGTLHGEGSQAAQALAILRDYDVDRCKQLVRDGAGIRT